MKTYKLITQEYVSFAKRKIDMIYSTTAETPSKAVDNLYTCLKNYKWTKDMIRKELYE